MRRSLISTTTVLLALLAMPMLVEANGRLAVQKQVVVQRQRIIQPRRQRVVVEKQVLQVRAAPLVLAPVYQQSYSLGYVAPQAYTAPAYQLQSGCMGGVQQLNYSTAPTYQLNSTGGCGALLVR